MFSKKGCIISCVQLFVIFFLTFHQSQSEKIRYTTDKLCDRHSLDAVYHEKYKLITNNIFADIKEFVSRVADLTTDSLTSIMAQLPDRDVSDNEERKVYTQFQNIKKAFTSKVKKIQKNITTSWEELIPSHFDLMFDNGKSSLEDYLNKTIRMTDSYTNARKTLDTLLSSFIDVIKSTVRDGLVGIKMAAQEALKNDEKKKNETEKGSSDTSDSQKKTKEELLQDKMVEISKDIVLGFLGKITVEVIQRKMDLSKKSGIKPENRDSVLDDIEFDMLMVKNRIGAIIQTDVPRDKGATDLARRSIYTYWTEQADVMYKDKIKSKKSADSTGTGTGRLYYRNLWKDEEQIDGYLNTTGILFAETLLNLMEIYP